MRTVNKIHSRTMISIIIITLNEEKNISTIIESLIKQTYKDFEVIIIDGNSTDNTEKICRSYQEKIKNFSFNNIEKKGVSLQRNEGAKLASGEYLFFMDADISFDKNFLQKSLDSLYRKNLDAAGVYLKARSKNVIDKIFYSIMNIWFFLMQKIYPHCVGSCMIAKKTAHITIGGFDERINLAEDNDYVFRIHKLKLRFGVIPTIVNVSTRRFEKEGRLKMGIQYIQILLHRIFLGEIKKDKFNYKFGHYDETNEK